MLDERSVTDILWHGHGIWIYSAPVTPTGHAFAWAIMSNEQPHVHRALANAGVIGAAADTL
jgi:hypothetical protein